MQNIFVIVISTSIIKLIVKLIIVTTATETDILQEIWTDYLTPRQIAERRFNVAIY